VVGVYRVNLGLCMACVSLPYAGVVCHTVAEGAEVEGGEVEPA
jgi:hypothetical protein